MLCPGWTNTNLGAASRNRPAALGTAPDQLDIITPGMAEGMDPIDVGRHALRGVRENALYVFTHPEFQPLIADRFAKVIAALERAKEAREGAVKRRRLGPGAVARRAADWLLRPGRMFRCASREPGCHWPGGSFWSLRRGLGGAHDGCGLLNSFCQRDRACADSLPTPPRRETHRARPSRWEATRWSA